MPNTEQKHCTECNFDSTKNLIGGHQYVDDSAVVCVLGPP